MMWMLGVAMASQIQDRHHAEVTLNDGTHVTLTWFSQNGRVTERPTLRFHTDRWTLSPACPTGFYPRGLGEKVYQDWVNFVAGLPAKASAHPNADLGRASSAARRLIGSNREGWCGLGATTRDGKIRVRVSQNRACFGDAGCNTNDGLMSVTGPDIQKLQEVFLLALRLQPKTADPTQGLAEALTEPAPRKPKFINRAERRFQLEMIRDTMLGKQPLDEVKKAVRELGMAETDNLAIEVLGFGWWEE